MSVGTRYIIPAKFFFLIFHLLAISIALYSPLQNIYAGIPINIQIGEGSHYDPALSEVRGIAGTTIFFLVVEIIILILGRNLFYDFFNMIQIFIHFIGAFLTTWYVIDGWNYRSLKYLFGIFSVIPLCLEFFPIFAQCMKKRKQI